MSEDEPWLNDAPVMPASDPFAYSTGASFVDPNPPPPAQYESPPYASYPQAPYPQAPYPGAGGPPIGNAPSGYSPTGYPVPAYSPTGYGYPMSPVGGLRPGRSPRRIWTGVAIAVAVVLVGGAVAAVTVDNGSSSSSAGSGHSIKAPFQSGDYTQITGSTTDRLISSARAAISSSGGWNADAVTIAIYSRGSSSVPGLVFLGGNRSDLPMAADISSSDVVDEIMISNGVSDSDSVDDGGFGGTARCGTSVPRCAWADSSTFGELVYVDATVTDARTAAVQFRQDAEH